MSMLLDIDQSDRIERLEAKVRRLERNNVKGENNMSGIVKELVGMRCLIQGDSFYEDECTILDADEEWVKLIVHEKKKDVTKIVRIDAIDEFILI